MDIVYYILWVLVIILISVLVYQLYQLNQYEKFTIDSYDFLVEKCDDTNRKQASLEALIEIRRRLNILVNHLIKKYPNNSYVERLYNRFKDTVLKESNPSVKDKQTSYTINKGDTMVICLRKTNGEVVDNNTLTYVAVHELAHIYSSSLHHSDEFWENMRFLLREAIKCNIYTNTNYKQNPVDYCGLNISTNLDL